MGKNKYIETPEKMWEYFLAYKKEVKSNPILVHDFVGKDAESVYRKKERCLTLDGFENWCADNNIIESIDQYFSNQDNIYLKYMAICSRIKKTIRQDQIEGGMVGIYNPSITQRLNNLVEKTETKAENINKIVKWIVDDGEPDNT